MTRQSHRKRRQTPSAREYPRRARLNELLREIIAEEFERIDDERLGLMTVTGVEVDNDLNLAQVFYTAIATGEEIADDVDIAEVLDEHRRQIKSAIGRQARVRKVPELSFEPDPAVSGASRVEEILRELHPES